MSYKLSPKMNDLTTMLLDGYFAGTLPAGTKDWLESRLNEEPELRREVEAHRLSIAALRERGQRDNEAFTQAMQQVSRTELEQALNSLRQSRAAASAASTSAETPAASAVPAASAPSDAKPKHRLLWNTLSAAALVCGVWFGARTFYKSQGAQQSADTYIATTSTAKPEHGIARGSDEPLGPKAKDWSTDTVCLTEVTPQFDDVELIMAQASGLLKNGHYEEAIKLLEPLYKESGELREVGLLLATAYVKAQESDKAQQVLHVLNQRYANDPEVEALSKAYTD